MSAMPGGEPLFLTEAKEEEKEEHRKNQKIFSHLIFYTRAYVVKE
jgi:hypothetical protein